MSTFIPACILILTTGFSLFFYIDQRNQLTLLRLEIPSLAKEVKNLQEENKRLRYEIDSFESPLHLMELARQPEFSHLKHPYINDIIQIKREATE